MHNTQLSGVIQGVCKNRQDTPTPLLIPEFTVTFVTFVSHRA